MRTTDLPTIRKQASATTPKGEPRGHARAPRDISSRIVDVVASDKPIRAVLYGLSGSGKTTLACSFPAPLLLDIKGEEGTDSVTDIKGLKMLAVESWDDLESAYWYLHAGDHPFQTVVIDTVTLVQELAIRHVMIEHKKNEEEAGGWGSMTKAMWGEVSSMMKTWLTNFRNLPINVVFLAQERIFNAGDDADTEEGQIAPEVGPRLMPSIVSHINAAVDLIGNTFIREKIKRKKTDGKIEETREIQYCLRIGPHAYYTTKLRKPKDIEVPAFLVDPSYEDIVDLKKGG